MVYVARSSKANKAKTAPKARVAVRETEREDIGPQYKVELDHGIEISLEEHERVCGCCLSGVEDNWISEDEDEWFNNDEEDW